MTLGENQAEGRTDPRAALYRERHPQLVGFIWRRIGGDRSEAEALAQETWIAFLRRFDAYQQDYDNPIAPLFVIARRKVIDWSKAQNRAPQLLDGEDFGEHLMAAQSASDAIDHAGLRIDLARAAAHLTPRQREALQLYYIDGQDRSAVAELMGITVDGVKKLLSVAIKALSTGRGLDSYLPPTAGLSRTCKEVRK